MCQECLQWDGHVWHRYSNGYYAREIRLHREMWERAHGPIPKGFHVHHKNDDKTDNRLDNLELLSHGEHSSRHMEQKIGPYRKQAMQASIAANQRRRAILRKRELHCIICGGIYHSAHTHPTAFCSNACRYIATGTPYNGEDRICAHCASEYRATKRAQRYCSRRCNRYAAEARISSLALRKLSCAQCGAEFESVKCNARFCRRECAVRFHSLSCNRPKATNSA